MSVVTALQLGKPSNNTAGAAFEQVKANQKIRVAPPKRSYADFDQAKAAAEQALKGQKPGTVAAVIVSSASGSNKQTFSVAGPLPPSGTHKPGSRDGLRQSILEIQTNVLLPSSGGVSTSIGHAVFVNSQGQVQVVSPSIFILRKSR